MNRFVEENKDLPQALRNLIAYYRSPEGSALLDRWEGIASGKGSLFFAGMGTSEFTSRDFAGRLLSQGRLASSFDAGELIHQDESRLPGDVLFVLTSQSGESAEMLKLAASGVAGDFVAITNNEDSRLAKAAALTLPLCAGDEFTITTKTYSNNLALNRILEGRLVGKKAADTVLKSLEVAAAAMEKTDDPAIGAAAELLCGMNAKTEAFAFAGRVESLVSARQCGLTYMEGLKRPAASFSGGGFRHGPFEAVGPKLGLILFRSSERTAAIVDKLAVEAAGFGSPVVVFDGCPKAPFEAVPNSIRIGVPVCSGGTGLFPVLAARSHNMLLNALAGKIGIETGHFVHGGKVTREE